MKREIDLRPREFIQARPSPRRRLTLAVIAVTAAGAVLLGLILAEHWLDRFGRELDVLKQDNLALAEQAAPLARLQAEIRLLEEKEELQSALAAQQRPWSFYLRQIEEALPDGFRLTAVTAAQGRLTISGAGPALPEIASYSQALNRLDYICGSPVSGIDLDPAGDYRFTIQVELIYQESEDRSQESE